MSFTTLNKKELLRAVERFEVPGVSDENTRAEIIAALDEAEVSWSNYKKFVESKEVDPEEVGTADEENVAEAPKATDKFSEMVLLKMTRANGTFEINGHRFTKAQPFKLLSAGEAQDIIDVADRIGGGFRIASPAEAQSFFG